MSNFNNEFGGESPSNLFDLIAGMPQPPDESARIQEAIEHHEEHILLADRIEQRYNAICDMLRENIIEEHRYPLGEEDMESLREFAGRSEMIRMFKVGERMAVEHLRKTQSEAAGD